MLSKRGSMIAGEIHFGNGNNAVATAQRRMVKLPRLEDEEEGEEDVEDVEEEEECCWHLFSSHHYRANGAVNGGSGGSGGDTIHQ